MRIPLHRPWIGPDEESAMLNAFRTGRLAGNGPECRALEDELRDALTSRHAVVVASATAALEIGMHALDVSGGEVIVPSFTFPSIGNAIVRAGGRPVFCEVREPDLNADEEHVRALIGPHTRAVVLTHYAGHPSWIEGVSVPIVEDAAHALGSTLGGQACGTLGQVGCVSFHQTKNVVAGEGGALLTRSAEIAGTAEIFREKGTNRDDMLRGHVDFYTWVGLGSSLVLPELGAAIARVQLRKLDEITSARTKVARLYDERLQDLADRDLLRRVSNPGPGTSCHHIYAILVEPEIRAAVLQALSAQEIGAASHFVPLHASPFGRHVAPTGKLPRTDRLAASVVRLPIYPDLGEAEIDQVCTTLESALLR